VLRRRTSTADCTLAGSIDWALPLAICNLSSGIYLQSNRRADHLEGTALPRMHASWPLDPASHTPAAAAAVAQ
jgi:hypothetical protein